MHDYSLRLMHQYRHDQFEREADASRLAAEARRGRTPSPSWRPMPLFAGFLRWVHLARPASAMAVADTSSR